MVAQLTKGGDFRPFVTSQFSKEVAKRISRDAPMGDYLRPLLNGEYQVAARVAWKRARLSREATEHETWIKATALAVACQDQYRGGRAAAFLKWGKSRRSRHAANKGVTPDSLAKYLDDAPLPFQPTDEELAAAAAQLSQIKTITWSLDPEKLFGRVLPDNDVLVFAMHTPDPVGHYTIYLWRTPGRATAAELGVVKNQAIGGGSGALLRCFPAIEATRFADLRQGADEGLSQGPVERRSSRRRESGLEKGTRRQNQ